jgi:proteic killer suppression protein
VIASFKSRSLKRLWERGEARRLPAQFVDKIALVLDALDAATSPNDLDLPGSASTRSPAIAVANLR